MTQVLIYSIQSEHVLNFLNGRKTIEVRRRDLPQWAKDKLARGEIVEGYGYCTMGKPYLHKNQFGYQAFSGNKKAFLNGINILNGKVVVKFQVSGSDKIYDYHIVDGTVRVSSIYETDNLLQDELLDKACLTLNQISKYVGMNDSYAHHFTNITPIEPMGIGEFYKYGKDYGADICEFSPFDYDNDLDNCLKSFQLTKAPQSFQTVWVKGE